MKFGEVTIEEQFGNYGEMLLQILRLMRKQNKEIVKLQRKVAALEKAQR